MPIQTQLRLRDPRYTRPLATIDTAKGILDLSEDGVLALIEEQGALIAFNVATTSAKSRDLRILTLSISEYIRDGLGSDCYHSTLQPRYAAIEAAAAIGHQKPFLTGTEVQRILNCSSTHVINLIESGSLKTVANSSWQRGPGGSPKIDRQSLITFLTDRYVC